MNTCAYRLNIECQKLTAVFWEKKITIVAENVFHLKFTKK